MQAELIRDELLLRAGHPQVLPTLNSIMSELLQVLSDENSSLPQLFDIIRCDQAISSKVISIANSAFYCRRSRVLSLERAILLIGLDEIKNLLMCLIFLKKTLSFGKFSQLDLEHSAK